MPAGLNRPSSDIEPIVGIQFGIFSPDEIERRSVVEITNAGTYDGNEPRIGGLFDPRMGVLDNGKTCRSCGQTNHSCPGHFGHFKLARPVYFIQFFGTILNVLNCVCVRCSKLLIDKNLHKEVSRRKGEQRWRAVLGFSNSITRCGQEGEDGCGARQPDRYVREGIARIVAEWDEIEGPGAQSRIVETAGAKPTKQRQYLEVEYVQRLFRRITDEDVDFIGLSRFWCRPDWMICSVMPIPPPQVRPSVIQDNNQRSEDDLTHKLFEIIMTNHRLQDKINNNVGKNLIEDEHTVLQYHVATLVDNQIPGVAPSAQRSGRPLKSVQQRLGSKEGRIRYNIQGKRVEFSARSVITPDPNISIGELGVPEKIAMNLTFPEKVTPYNMSQMYKLIQNVGPKGEDRHPGAKTIIRSDGRMISLKHINRKEIVLHVGDVINRHIMDGDIVLFNRQPTLHRMSMMGHRVRVLPYNTFRLNVSVTAPYNADFDGDEMNAHIPQSYESATELAEIAAVPNQIVTPRHAKPVIGIVQDTLVGSYRMTQGHVTFNRQEFMNMMMWNRRFEGVVPKGEKNVDGHQRWSGQQIIGELLPPINMDMGNGLYKDNKSQDNIVKIREGKILQGVFDKDIFSKPSKGIIHVAFKDYGPKDTVNFIDSMQNTVEQFLVYNGFSVGISDLIADEDTRKQMEEVIKKRKVAIENTLLQIHMDLFENNTGKSNRQEFEDKVYGELNKATEEAGKIGLGSLSDENRLVAMVRAGSKGSTINIAQMMACVGQQAPEGRRIPYGFTDRTLPHYKKYDDGAEARGFVESSFIEGLTPQEFFFHAMSGREGLIDTAVKTADTGYIQRQLVKAMEDLTTQYDGTVRDSRMNILQFQYGEDGINATKIESVGLGLAKLSETEILKQYGMEGVDMSAILEEGVQRGEDGDALKQFALQIVADQTMLIQGIQRSKQDASLFASVNIERVLNNTAISFRLAADKKTDLTPVYILNGIDRVIRRTQTYHKLWAALLRYNLAPHKLIVKERFTKKAFDTACEMLLIKNWQSWVQPGEQVGIIAAQSIGEPSTQMSSAKDTFVHIVTSQKNFAGKISNFVDSLLEEHKNNVVSIGHDSVVLDLIGDEFSIMGVSTTEKTSWLPIRQVSRHPANGGLVKVITKSGRTTTATLSHSFLKRSERGIIPVLGSDLKVGMRIPISMHVPEVLNVTKNVTVGNTTFALTKEFGWLCGMYIADGYFSGNTVSISKIEPIIESEIRKYASEHDWTVTAYEREGEYGPSKSTNIYSKDLKNFLMTHFGIGSYTKMINGSVYSMTREFQQGIVGGYFDGDGNVNAEKQMIRASSRCKELVRQMNRLLSYCGFFAALGEETSVRIPGKVQYTLNILKKYAMKFKEEIGLKMPEKAANLDLVVEYMNRTDKHDTKELYDKIPELGAIIAETGKILEMPGQSRNYGRWAKKESVGRSTLEGYIIEFQKAADKLEKIPAKVTENIAILQAAVDSDVLWDEIVDLVYLDDPKEYVYDFTVPGNDSFMVDDCILVHNTLNSVDWDTKIMIAKNGKILTPQIGEFIDACLNADAENIQEFPNKQLYLDLKDGNDWKAISCDENGKMMWTKLEAVTRHPVVNEDGTDTILEVELASGRTVKATKGKSFLTERDGKVQDINGADLKVGDLMPIANTLVLGELGHITEINLPSGSITLDHEFGTRVGSYFTRDCISSEEDMQAFFGSVSYEKILPDWIFQAPDDFVKGFVERYINCDGVFDIKTGIIQVTSASKNLLTRVGTLMARYNIFTTVTTNIVGADYTLTISGKYAKIFNQTFTILDIDPDFIQNTNTHMELNDIVWDTVRSIKEVVPIKGWVYDLTVETTRNFMTEACHVLKDTFHLAGVAAKSNVTRGVPRLKELLKVTHNPKAISLTVYLKPEFRGSKDKARQVAQDLELTLLKDITVKTAVYFDPSDSDTIVKDDTDLIKFYKLFEREGVTETTVAETWSGWLLRFEMDRDKMFRKNISMDDVAYVLRTRFGESLHLIYSDYNSNKLVMRMRLPEQMKSGLDDLTNLKKFQSRILNGIVFRGVPGIKGVTFREDKDMLELVDGSYKQVTQYVLDTDGSNYIQVMNHPYVDSKRLSSSHVHDIYEVLGIEATRAVLLNEITTLFEEAGVNNRHLGLLCDVMTRGGRLMSADRHGINKTDIGPLAKASFEETEKILLNAALFGELDPITGVSANIMTGQPIRGGTGFFNVLLDESAFMRLQEGMPPLEEGEEEEEQELTREEMEAALYEDENDICSSARLRMNVTLPTTTTMLEEPDMEVVIVK